MTTVFGTDGIRSTVGSQYLTQEKLPILGQAIALWAHQKYGAHPRILIAHDTRISCTYIKTALKSGLLLHPIHIFDAGILPTPAAFHLIQQNSYDAALIISASHNPYYDNGIKLVDRETGKLSHTDEILLSRLLSEETTGYFSYDTFGTDNMLLGAADQYIKIIQNLFSSQFLHGIKIVLDTAHGASSYSAPAIFSALGAHVIVINNAPTGKNINEQCGALHTQQLQDAVVAHNADIGFAFDGDGDRVVMVNKQGQVKDGDDILALLITHPDYLKTNTIVGTVMTNCGFEAFLKNQHKELIRTPVGDKYIAEKLRLHNLKLGGEPSGHIILQDVIHTGDGILVALKCIETIIKTENWDIVTFEKYPQVLINVPVATRTDLSVNPFADIINHAQKNLNNGRLIVRFSGTEPVLRVMVEAPTHTTAQTIAHTVAKTLEQKIKDYA